MSDVHLRQIAARQDDLVAGWQLVRAGWTRAMIDHRLAEHGWRSVHDGVYAMCQAPLTQRQRWRAATLTTPDSVLSHASSAACWGLLAPNGPVEAVTRPGSGGRERFGNLLVFRSLTLDEDVTRHEGIKLVTAARTLLDLAPSIGSARTARLFREALRLRRTTTSRICATLHRHRGRRGTVLLRELCSRYAEVPYARTRSDAEALALERLVDAGVPLPSVNVRVAGREADLVYPGRRLIVEIDGPQYHQFSEEDAAKERAWRAAGFEVRRLPSGAVYDGPDALLRLVTT